MDATPSIRTHVEPIEATEARQVSLEALPQLIRETSEQKAAIAFEWAMAFRQYKERRATLINYLHREAGLGITAAENSADIDPSVVEAGEYSRRLKEQMGAFERAERQLLQEFEVKTIIARANCK